MPRFLVNYGKTTYRIIAESFQAAAVETEKQYGPGWISIGDSVSEMNQKQLQQATGPQAPANAPYFASVNYEPEEDYFDAGPGESKISKMFDSEPDRRMDIMESLNRYTCDLKIDDDKILKPLAKCVGLDKSIGVIVNKSLKNQSVQPGTVGTALCVLYEAYDKVPAKAKAKKSLRRMIHRLEYGIVEEQFNYSGDILMLEALENGSKEGYKQKSWDSFWKGTLKEEMEVITELSTNPLNPEGKEGEIDFENMTVVGSPKNTDPSKPATPQAFDDLNKAKAANVTTGIIANKKV